MHFLRSVRGQRIARPMPELQRQSRRETDQAGGGAGEISSLNEARRARDPLRGLSRRRGAHA
jgi:hypothetical protein